MIARVDAWLKAEREHLAGFETTYGALALSILLLSMIPQVHTVMFEGPDLRAVAGGGWFTASLAAAGCFYAVHFVLIAVFAMGFRFVPWMLWSTWTPKEWRRLDGVSVDTFGADALRLLPWLVIVFALTLTNSLQLEAWASALFQSTVVFAFGMAWFTVLRIVRADTPDRETLPWLTARPLFLLVFLVVGLGVQAFLERLIPDNEAFLSWRLYAFIGAYHVCAALILIGFVADRVMTHLPCRAAFLGGLTAAYLGLSMVSDGVPLEARDGDWNTAFQERMDLTRSSDEPVVLVALAGGGTRAAALGMLALESLRRWGHEDRIVLISSVSGGSLAAAHFTHGPREWSEDTYAWKTAFPRDLAFRMANEDEDVDAILAWWAFRNGHVDAMFTNFDAAILKGINFPWLSRGEALAAFWTQHLGWKSLQPNRPLLLLNTTRVDTGTRISVGIPPLPETAFRDRWNERGTYAPLSGYRGRTVPLATAVRMSSAFPWGLDSPRIEADPTRPDERPSFRTIDGGVFDNTGLSTLAERVVDLPPHLKDALRDRGVVVVEIDAGAKSTDAGGGVLGALTDPLTALGHAAVARERVLRRHADAVFEEALCDGQPSGCVLKSYRRITLSYDPKGPCGKLLPDDVPTAWTLGPADMAETLRLYRCLEGDGATTDKTRFHGHLTAVLASLQSFKAAPPVQTDAAPDAEPDLGLYGPPQPPATNAVRIRLDTLPADFALKKPTGTRWKLTTDVPVQAIADPTTAGASTLIAGTEIELRGLDEDGTQQGMWVQAVVPTEPEPTEPEEPDP